MEPSATVMKHCATCGLDVARQKRFKDPQGTYFCPKCWVERHEVTVAPSEPELLFCEACSGSFLKEYLTLQDGEVLCADCVRARRKQKKVARQQEPKGSSARLFGSSTSSIQSRIKEIGVAQRQLMWAILFSLVSVVVFPLLIVTLPLQVFRTARLATALGKNGLLWGILAAVPYLGILTLLIINGRATRELKSAGVKVGLMGAKF